MIENKRKIVMKRTTTNEVGTEALEQEIKHVVETAVTREEIEDAAGSQPVFDYHENNEYIGIHSEGLYHIRSQRLANTFGELDSDECAIDWSTIANTSVHKHEHSLTSETNNPYRSFQNVNTQKRTTSHSVPSPLNSLTTPITRSRTYSQRYSTPCAKDTN